MKPQLKAPFWMTRNLKRGLKLGDSSTKLDDTKIFNFLWAKAESVGIKNESFNSKFIANMSQVKRERMTLAEKKDMQRF